METIHIPKEVYIDLVFKIDRIAEKIEHNSKRTYPLTERWLDVDETCEVLKISKRTLQKYRDEGILGFSQKSGIIRFKASDLEKFLKENYVSAFSTKKNKRHERNGI